MSTRKALGAALWRRDLGRATDTLGGILMDPSYEVERLRARVMEAVASHLPRSLVCQCAIRVFSYATVAQWSDQEVPALTVTEALERWHEPHVTAGVVGRRSTRWAFMERLTIPCHDGLVYLARLRILCTPLFGVMLHDIYEPDADRDPHTHPWTFVSIVLRGAYTEVVQPQPEYRGRDGSVRTVVKHHKRWSVHRMSDTAAHRITYAEPGLRTLILTGRRTGKGWGFWTEDGYMPWQQYVARRAGAS